MVFCGKPSKGCTNCRLRRIKCDQKDPSCSQCLRAGKSCSGYRDPQALMFRDENARIIRKARSPKTPTDRRARHNDKRVTKDSDVPDSASPCSLTTAASTPSPIRVDTFVNEDCQPLVPPRISLPFRPSTATLDDPGINFFFTHYVSVVSTLSTGKLDLTSSPMWRLLNTNQPFNDAVSSVGLAGLSNVTKDQGIMVLARNKYASTVSHVMAALNDLGKANLEHTFKAVMMLAIFEVVNCDSESIASWGVHIDGAAAVLRTINSTKTKSKLRPGTRMQLQFCFAVFIRYFQSGQPFPAEFDEWSRHCRDSQRCADYPASILVGIIGRFIDIHACIRNHIFVDSDSIIREAHACEVELEAWEAHLPIQWEFTTLSTVDGEQDMFRGQYHTYRDFWTARIYNHYRWARILVNELLLMHLDRVSSCPFNIEQQRERSLATISKMALDICTSVSSQFWRHSVEDAKIRFVPAMNGVFLLLFPLAVAGSAKGVPEDLHHWVIALLDKIGNTMGVQQALKLIPMTKRLREQWALGTPVTTLQDPRTKIIARPRWLDGWTTENYHVIST